MKICFMGAGALGPTIGGVPAEGGHEVRLIDRHRAHADALEPDGVLYAEPACRAAA